MKIEYKQALLAQLEADAAFTGGFPPAVASIFRKRIQFMRATLADQDLYAMKSLDLQSFKGYTTGAQSMRINEQWRLIFRIKVTKAAKVLEVLSIEENT